MLALQIPSPATASPFTPSSCIVVELNVPPLAASTRQRRLAVMLPGVSSFSWALIVTVSVDLGISGVCDTLVIKGATLALATELATPGVPCSVLLAAQFWPSLLPSAELISSRDFPSPSA